MTFQPSTTSQLLDTTQSVSFPDACISERAVDSLQFESGSYVTRRDHNECTPGSVTPIGQEPSSTESFDKASGVTARSDNGTVQIVQALALA